MKRLMYKQKGISLVGLIFISMLLIFVALLGMKVTPSIIEYQTTLSNIKATASDPALQGAGVPQIRNAYLRRIQVSGESEVKPEDLDVSKDSGEVVISFAYSKRIPLFANVSLMIDYEGSSSGSAGK
jgi:hypothetical protein